VRRANGLATLAALAVSLTITAGASAAPAVRVAGADTSGYPRIVVSVVTQRPTPVAPVVRENGGRVSGVDAVNLAAAKSVVLAIDTSQSMAGGSLHDAAAAAHTFVDAKAAGDRISVISFGRHPVQLTGFSPTTGEADNVLNGLSVDDTPGTALYDAIVSAAHSLDGASEGGRVIIVLTDGRDVSSNATLAQAVDAARKVDASIYPIGIESSDFDPAALRTIATETGGSYHGVGSSAELQQVYASIAAELQRTWRISYDTTARPGDHVRLDVTAPHAGVAQSTFDVPSSFGAPAAGSSSSLPSFAYTPLGTLVLGLIVGFLVLCAVFALVRFRRGSWVKARLAPHIAQTKQSAGPKERLSFLKALFKATEGAFGGHAKWRVIERMLVRGDVPLRAAEFVWISLGCAVVGGFVFSAAGAPGALILIAMLGACAVPYAVVSMRVRRRSKAFENQLPDLLTTIAASLKAGHSFKHGLQAVVDEAQPPASIELRRVLTEAGLGRPLDDALGDMAERIGSENFGFAITAVTIQRQVGGSLATLFDMVSETVRNRQQFARKIRSLTAMGRMSAYTLIGIPFFIAGMISLTNPSYMSPLWHGHLGHILLFLGLGMMTVGSLILKKIVSFRG
jgi:tight adherence protein B